MSCKKWHFKIAEAEHVFFSIKNRVCTFKSHKLVSCYKYIYDCVQKSQNKIANCSNTNLQYNVRSSSILKLYYLYLRIQN